LHCAPCVDSFVFCLFTLTMKLVGAFCMLGAATATPTQHDLQRAQRAVPGDSFRAPNPAAIREKLNYALKKGALKMSRGEACEEFALAELAELQKTFFQLRSPELFTQDLRAPRHSSMSELLEELAEEGKYVKMHPEVEEALRDGKCAELAMQWVHHLSEGARGKLAEARLPLLANKGTAEHAPKLINGGHHHVAKKLTSQVTCQTGHDAKAEARGSWAGFPDWPYEVEYNATGYGPYPFWTAAHMTANFPPSPSPTTGAPIHTYWSAVLNAEKLEHNGQCDLTGVGGGFSADGPCTHLMLGTQYAYLYDNAQTHCCISSEPSYPCHMTTMPRDFVTTLFDYKGTIENYVSESGYFNGTVKHYSTQLSTGGLNFWYVTDQDNKPIEQGEGGCDFTGSHTCSSGGGKYLWHQYNPATFKEATLDPAVFAVPEVCKSTSSKCEVTPTFFCSGTTKDLIV